VRVDRTAGRCRSDVRAQERVAEIARCPAGHAVVRGCGALNFE